MVKHVLVIEDEVAIREMIVFVLELQSYILKEAKDYQTAIEQLTPPYPDLVIVDWMLPGGTGIELIRIIKANPLTKDIPIIMLSAKGETEDRVQGLDSGADDYIVKPFSPKELIARINALIRRLPPKTEPGNLISESSLDIENNIAIGNRASENNVMTEDSDILRINGICLDIGTHRVMLNGQHIALGPLEFRLLHFFMSNPERVYSRDQLLDQVWGANVYVEDRTVDVVIRRLRKILTPSAHDEMIQTVRGAGYRFSSIPKINI
jgi:two-component system phosphate regulon response regulator PhoB